MLCTIFFFFLWHSSIVYTIMLNTNLNKSKKLFQHYSFITSIYIFKSNMNQKAYVIELVTTIIIAIDTYH